MYIPATLLIVHGCLEVLQKGKLPTSQNPSVLIQGQISSAFCPQLKFGFQVPSQMSQILIFKSKSQISTPLSITVKG